MKRTTTFVLSTAILAAAEGYHVTDRIKVGGAGGWDYLSMDDAARRLYVSHGNSVEVIDVDAGKKVGEIPDLQGVHGVAVAPELNKGFTSNGRTNNVTVFDLKSLHKIGEVATGGNPDAICYEPKTQRIFTFNGRSNDFTAIDAKSNAVVGTFPVGKKPEFCAVDGAGKIYANIEDSSELVEIDASKPAVTRRMSLAPCEEPSGLAIDRKGQKLFSVCGNKMMAVTDAKSMKVIATPAIGQGPDAAGFDPASGLAFSSNGRDGTITIVKQVKGKYEAVDTVPTEMGARTLTVDEKAHRVYLSAAEYGPVTAPENGKKKARPPVVPGSFHILVLAK